MMSDSGSPRIRETLYDALVAGLFALGILWPLCAALQIGTLFTAAAAALLTLAAAVLCSPGPRRLLRAGAALVLVAAAAAAGLFSRMGQVLHAMTFLLGANAGPLRVYAREAGVFFAVLITLFSWGITRQRDGVYAACVLFAASLMMVWMSGRQPALPCFLPAAAALLILLARTGSARRPGIRAAALAAAIALAAGGLAASLTPRSLPLERFARDLRTYILDTLFFDDPRSIYTIGADGYLPLGNRLGGSADPENLPVMTVECDTPVLLRGTLKNHYSGLSWADSLSTRRYLLSNPRYQSLKADYLDLNRPSASLRDGDLFAKHSFRVTMYATSASTLFAAARADDLEMPLTMVPYFNASGELFITRNLEPGDTYSFTAPVIDPLDGRLDDLLEAAARKASPVNRTEYMNVPDAVADGVRTLAQKLCTGCETPLAKARAMYTYLVHNFPYTLEVEEPPDNQDFVSFFLLKGKEGYCTYFASAMTVLCRLADLPARYVEGYSVMPNDGIAFVTSRDAHAWCEVWFDGFGWLAFDPTPESPDQPPQTPPEQNPDDNTDNDPDENTGDDPDGNDSSDSDGNDGPDGSGGDSGQDAPPPDAPDATPSPSPDPGPDATPTPPPPEEDPDEPDDRGSPFRPWLWLLLVLAAAAAVLRLWLTHPATLAPRQKTEEDRLAVWYRAILALLAAAGLGVRVSEAPQTHAQRIGPSLPDGAGFDRVAGDIELMGYGHFHAEARQVARAEACFRVLHRGLPLPAKIRWTLRRLVRGAGDPKRIP